MLKKFMDKDFMLQNKAARKLYHQYAKDMPIIDYHCHLPPEEIAEDKNFENLTQVWLYGDHYKWRAMRTNGVDEKYCTGDASDFEKFKKWAETVPYTMRNPLYHWTHMELKQYFGINKLLNPDTAYEIFEQTKEKLQQKAFSVRNLCKRMKVKVVCTTDDPTDTLENHQKIKQENIAIKVLPAWRPDKAMAVENPGTFNTYIDKLAQVAGQDIKSYNDLLEVLRKRHDFFHEQGSRLSDHGLLTMYAADYTEKEVKSIFEKVRGGNDLNEEEQEKIKSAMLYEFALMDYEKGWVQQFHVSAMRNNNTRMFGQLGPDTGFDSIADVTVANPMSRFFDKLAQDQKLTKTIIYNLNPKDNAVMATMLGNFQDGKVPGKMQWGSGWWFLDQEDGIVDQLNTLSRLGLLSRFVGMLTDSRSFLSFPRHDYFRRILCNLIGTDVEQGKIPAEMDFLGQMVQDICYNNANQYFGFLG